MKNIKKIVLPTLLALSGCQDDNGKSAENKSHSYYFSSDTILSTALVEREWHEGYNLNQIDFKLANDHSYFEIINTTPRYIYKPKFLINADIYQIEAALNPFEVMKVSLADFNQTVKVMKYIDEQPMFKATVKQYGGVEHEDRDDPLKHNAAQYEKEIRGLKSALNDYDLAIRSLTYIDDFHESQSTNTRTTQHEHDYMCMWDSYFSKVATDEADNTAVDTRIAKAIDTSTTNSKMLSLYAWEPIASYMMLNNNANPGTMGVASIGHGWLSARESALYQEAQVYPKQVFFHEKMHNNGFDHSGGMTYGIPDKVFVPYVKEGLWFDDFYDEPAIAKGISPVATTYQVEKISDGTLEITINFFGDKAVSQNYNLDKFVLIPSNNISIDEVKVVHGSEEQIVTPLYTHAEGKVGEFGNDLSINIRELDTQKTTATKADSVVVRVSNITSSDETLIFMGTSAEQGKVQANAILELNNLYLYFGFETEKDTKVFAIDDVVRSEDGTMSAGLNLFTPEEASDFCLSKGLELGPLPSSKSDKISLQNQYLKYQSQVGLNPETGEGEAYEVTSSYNTNYVVPAERGALVVCKSAEK